MDPLGKAEDATAGSRAAVVANQEEGEEILFSRPLNLMPTNPFADFGKFGKRCKISEAVAWFISHLISPVFHFCTE